MTKQERIEAATLHGAMALAFAKIEGATKSATNPHFKAKYADLGAVIEAVKPALIENGLFFTQHPQPSNGGVTVETFLHHVSGESLSLGALFVPADKANPQAYGSALTYARRYALVTAFGVPTEDDDGNAASKAPVADVPQDMLTDADRDMIATLADAAGKTLQEICASYKVANLKQLTAKQGAGVIKRLQELAKEPVNA